MKKIFTLLLLALTITVVAQETTKTGATVDRNSDGKIVALRGTCGAEGDGSNISWALAVKSGVLRIWGEGAMCNKFKRDSVPWLLARDYIKVVTFIGEITTIGRNSFYECKNLKTIAHLPNTLTRIGDRAFARTALDSITIGPLDKLDWYVFDECLKLKSVTFTGDIKRFGRGCFCRCINLEHVEMPKHTDDIVFPCFMGCDMLPVIDGIRYADTYMVEVVDKDKKACEVKEGTKWIQNYAFKQCSQMEKVTIPESVEDIGMVAFYNCVNLRSITCLATIPPKAHKDIDRGKDDTFTGLLPALITVYVPTQSVEAYKKDSKWGQFNIVGIDAKGTK